MTCACFEGVISIIKKKSTKFSLAELGLESGVDWTFSKDGLKRGLNAQQAKGSKVPAYFCLLSLCFDPTTSLSLLFDPKHAPFGNNDELQGGRQCV